MKRLETPRAVRKCRHERCRGAIMVMAMIALLVASMLGASLLRTATTSVRQLQREQQRMQAGWLADAGCQRAILRMRTEPDYAGEEWIVPADQLQSQSEGFVRITVATGPQAESKAISVVAEFPRNATQQSRTSKRITVTSTKPEVK